MLLPIRTNIKPWRTPYANYALIVLNIIIFLAQFHTDPQTGHMAFKQWVNKLMLFSAHPHLWQFITYAFLHGGFGHILGNMFFLYLFGNNVNDKLGNIGYTFFYLAGAVFSGIGHTLVSNGPVLGASGAVAAVTGAYLVLFPQTLVTIIYWFIFIGTFEVPALYFIFFKMIFIDNIIARTTRNVAYDAHLVGYTFGIITTLAILATGIITSNHFDLWAMLKQWNKRRQYRDSVSKGYDPFTGYDTTTKKIKVKEVKNNKETEKTRKIKQLRSEIDDWLTQKNLPTAAETYLELIELDSSQVLTAQHLLDIANQLASDNRHTEAAKAYEQFLTHYSKYKHAEQIQLMLGLIYSRYLNKPKPALQHLKAAQKSLSDTNQLKMCKDEIALLEE